MTDVDVSVDADGHDAHQGSETRYGADGRHHGAQFRTKLEPQLPFYDTCVTRNSGPHSNLRAV